MHDLLVFSHIAGSASPWIAGSATPHGWCGRAHNVNNVLRIHVLTVLATTLLANPRRERARPLALNGVCKLRLIFVLFVSLSVFTAVT